MSEDHPRNYPFGIVLWRDALGPFDVDDARTHEFAVTQSYTAGWFIRQDEDLVAVAGTWDLEPEQSGWRDVTTIPRGMIVELCHLTNPLA